MFKILHVLHPKKVWAGSSPGSVLIPFKKPRGNKPSFVKRSENYYGDYFIIIIIIIRAPAARKIQVLEAIPLIV